MSEIASMYRNINMRRYTTSAHGHELSGHVRAHAYNYYICLGRLCVGCKVSF